MYLPRVPISLLSYDQGVVKASQDIEDSCPSLPKEPTAQHGGRKEATAEEMDAWDALLRADASDPLNLFDDSVQDLNDLAALATPKQSHSETTRSKAKAAPPCQRESSGVSIHSLEFVLLRPCAAAVRDVRVRRCTICAHTGNTGIHFVLASCIFVARWD